MYAPSPTCNCSRRPSAQTLTKLSRQVQVLLFSNSTRMLNVVLQLILDRGDIYMRLVSPLRASAVTALLQPLLC